MPLNRFSAYCIPLRRIVAAKEAACSPPVLTACAPRWSAPPSTRSRRGGSARRPPASGRFVPIEARAVRRLHVAAIADGNNRMSEGGGYTAGASNVVDLAKHCVARGDVAMLCAVILSPENVAKRGEGFFAMIREQIQRLLAAELTTRVFSSVGIRCEIYGDLTELRRKGGAAADVADGFQALANATEDAAEPRLRLVFGIGYGPDMAAELDLDVIVRTGMDDPGMLRLSGLRTHPGVVCVSTTKLWPALTTGDLDAAIATAKGLMVTSFAPGFDPAFIAEIIAEAAEIEPPAPMQLTLVVAAPAAAMIRAIEGLDAQVFRGAVAVEYRIEPREEPRIYGPPEGARWTITILSPRAARTLGGEQSYAAFLVPGQRMDAQVLPDTPSLGYANAHACDATPRAIVRGVLAAHRSLAAHPLLLGAERQMPAGRDEGARPWSPRVDAMMSELDRRPHRSAEELARAFAAGEVGSAERELIAEAFVAKHVRSAARTDLLLSGAGRRRAAVNYVLTAFGMYYRGADDASAARAGWEADADFAARFMLSVAACDERIFDYRGERETEEDANLRLTISAAFLQRVARGDGTAAVPEVDGAAVLAAIASCWRGIVARCGESCSPALLEGWRRALGGYCAANLGERAEGVVENPLALAFASGGEARQRAIEAITARCASVPPVVAARIERLLRAPARDPEGSAADQRELRALLYLADVGVSIGAGALFRTIALGAPGELVDGRMADSLERTASLADYAFRLANDLSGLLDSATGDRDSKQNCWSILVPKGLAGAARQEAIKAAFATCRGLVGWLEGELGHELSRLEAAWPAMHGAVRRAMIIGRRVYEVGHYDSLSIAQMGAIFDELDAPSSGPRSRADGAPLSTDNAASLRM